MPLSFQPVYLITIVAVLADHEKRYRSLVPRYDRRTRAAYEVMGRRWTRFQDANAAFRASVAGSREFDELGERAYRLGLRSTRAYFLWTRGHTALALADLHAARERAA